MSRRRASTVPDRAWRQVSADLRNGLAWTDAHGNRRLLGALMSQHREHLLAWLRENRHTLWSLEQARQLQLPRNAREVSTRVRALRASADVASWLESQALVKRLVELRRADVAAAMTETADVYTPLPGAGTPLAARALTAAGHAVFTEAHRRRQLADQATTAAHQYLERVWGVFPADAGEPTNIVWTGFGNSEVYAVAFTIDSLAFRVKLRDVDHASQPTLWLQHGTGQTRVVDLAHLGRLLRRYFPTYAAAGFVRQNPARCRRPGSPPRLVDMGGQPL